MAGKTIVKMKFCEALDRFVEIRQFTDDEINRLFKNVKVTDKRAYKRLIINATVVNYLDEIAPQIFSDNNYSLFGEITEQELYGLCIKVNPNLDIKKVTITIEEDAGKERENNDGIPLLEGARQDQDEVEENITERLINMETYLQKRIVGQDEAVGVLAQAIRKAHVGLKSPERPIGVFLFVGQTGVGKTELAKALTEFLYGNENEIIRIDCSEYSASHEYAKLIGAPPGYIGHKDGGVLTEQVLNKPHSVVLFDEIEKADEKVHNLLLQIFDSGVLTDNKGTKIPFKNTVIIMTSNVGVNSVEKTESSIGFGDRKASIDHDFKTQEMLKSVRKSFKPEFLNRIDEIVNFRALDRDDNLKIVDIILNINLLKRLEEKKMELNITQEMREFIVDNGSDIKMGARPLKRAIYRFVESPLADLMLKNELVNGDKIIPVIEKDKIVYIKNNKAEEKPKKKKSKE